MTQLERLQRQIKKLDTTLTNTDGIKGQIMSRVTESRLQNVTGLEFITKAVEVSEQVTQLQTGWEETKRPRVQAIQDRLRQEAKAEAENTISSARANIQRLRQANMPDSIIARAEEEYRKLVSDLQEYGVDHDRIQAQEQLTMLAAAVKANPQLENIFERAIAEFESTFGVAPEIMVDASPAEQESAKSEPQEAAEKNEEPAPVEPTPAPRADEDQEKTEEPEEESVTGTTKPQAPARRKFGYKSPTGDFISQFDGIRVHAYTEMTDFIARAITERAVQGETLSSKELIEMLEQKFGPPASGKWNITSHVIQVNESVEISRDGKKLVVKNINPNRWGRSKDNIARYSLVEVPAEQAAEDQQSAPLVEEGQTEGVLEPTQAAETEIEDIALTAAAPTEEAQEIATTPEVEEQPMVETTESGTQEFEFSDEDLLHPSDFAILTNIVKRRHGEVFQVGDTNFKLGFSPDTLETLLNYARDFEMKTQNDPRLKRKREYYILRNHMLATLLKAASSGSFDHFVDAHGEDAEVLNAFLLEPKGITGIIDKLLNEAEDTAWDKEKNKQKIKEIETQQKENKQARENIEKLLADLESRTGRTFASDRDEITVGELCQAFPSLDTRRIGTLLEKQHIIPASRPSNRLHEARLRLKDAIKIAHVLGNVSGGFEHFAPDAKAKHLKVVDDLFPGIFKEKLDRQAQAIARAENPAQLPEAVQGAQELRATFDQLTHEYAQIKELAEHGVLSKDVLEVSSRKLEEFERRLARIREENAPVVTDTQPEKSGTHENTSSPIDNQGRVLLYSLSEELLYSRVNYDRLEQTVIRNIPRVYGEDTQILEIKPLIDERDEIRMLLRRLHNEVESNGFKNLTEQDHEAWNTLMASEARYKEYYEHSFPLRDYEFDLFIRNIINRITAAHGEKVRG